MSEGEPCGGTPCTSGGRAPAMPGPPLGRSRLGKSRLIRVAREGLPLLCRLSGWSGYQLGGGGDAGDPMLVPGDRALAKGGGADAAAAAAATSASYALISPLTSTCRPGESWPGSLGTPPERMWGETMWAGGNAPPPASACAERGVPGGYGELAGANGSEEGVPPGGSPPSASDAAVVRLGDLPRTSSGAPGEDDRLRRSSSCCRAAVAAASARTCAMSALMCCLRVSRASGECPRPILALRLSRSSCCRSGDASGDEMIAWMRSLIWRAEADRSSDLDGDLGVRPNGGGDGFLRSPVDWRLARRACCISGMISMIWSKTSGGAFEKSIASQSNSESSQSASSPPSCSSFQRSY